MSIYVIGDSIWMM